MRTRSATLVVSFSVALLLLVAQPAYSAVCNTHSIVGSYAMTLGGVNGTGRTVAQMGFFDARPADLDGFGEFDGDLYINERGDPPPFRVFVPGLYQIFSNCVVHFYLPASGRTDVVTGFVFDNGGLIIFSSVFDEALQVTGMARRAQ